MKDQRLRLAVRFFCGFGKGFAQYLLCMRMTFAAACADAEMVPQLRHRGDAGVHGLTDCTIGNVIADTDDH